MTWIVMNPPFQGQGSLPRLEWTQLTESDAIPTAISGLQPKEGQIRSQYTLLIQTSSDESIKITVRFLTNEIRSDGIRIIVHKKRCNVQQQCSVKKISSTLEQELQIAILKKAVLFEKEYNKTKKKYKREEIK